MLNDVAPIRGAVRLPARAFGVLVVLLGALSCGADEPATPVAVCDRAACDGCCDAHGGCRPAGSAACKGGSGSGGSNGSSAGGAGGLGGAGGAGTPGGAAGSPDSTAAGGGASGPVAGGAGASGASGGAGSSGASGGVGAAGAPSTECPNGTLVPVDIQPSINPPDTVAVLLSSTPGASAASRVADYRAMHIRPGDRWRLRLMVSPGDSTVGTKVPATIGLGPEDASSGMKLTVSLSRSCADFSPSAQLLPSLSGGGSVRLITADDTPGPNDGIITEPGLWFINVSVEKNADNAVACASGEAKDQCVWTFDYRAAKAP